MAVKAEVEESGEGRGPMGRPAEGLRRQGSTSWAVIPCLTPPTCHTIFVQLWHLTAFLVTLHTYTPSALSPLSSVAEERANAR